MSLTRGSYQSHAATSRVSTAPRRAGGTAPPATSATVRTPPSKFENLPPRSGWLLPAQTPSKMISHAERDGYF